MKLFRVTLAVITLLLSFQFLQAQDINEAKTAYNSALTAMKDKPAEAIKSLQACVDLCQKIGAPADSVMNAAKGKFAETYFNLGSSQARDKNFDGAVVSFNDAMKYGKETGNSEVLKRTSGALTRIYAIQANNAITAKDTAKAQTLLDQAIALDSANATVWLVQIRIFQESDNADGVESAVEKCLASSKNPNETRQAQQSAMKYFLSKGSKAVNGGKFDEGVVNLEKALKYDESNKDVIAFLAKAYNGTSNWDKAVETANKGITLEEDVPDKEAKYYFELGLALKGKGDKPAACEAFKKAMAGQYVENAKYEIEVDLKCGK